MKKAALPLRILRRIFVRIIDVAISPIRSNNPRIKRAVFDSRLPPYIVAGNKEIYVIPSSDKIIGREIFLNGQFDFEKLLLAVEILRREEKRCSHLIDVGANIGTIVIPAIKRKLFQTATAIEPHPSTCRLLLANLALNGILDSVKVFPVAVGNQSGQTLHLLESKNNNGAHRVSEIGIPIPSMMLDDLAISHEGALLWMDIEGYEGHALEGASQLLASGMPIVMEFVPKHLSNFGGLEKLEIYLHGRTIYDLQRPDAQSVQLSELAAMYKYDPSLPYDQIATDILIL